MITVTGSVGDSIKTMYIHTDAKIAKILNKHFVVNLLTVYRCDHFFVLNE